MERESAGFEEHALRTVDGLSLFYRDYGSRFATAAPVLCLAGLTRNARDFHEIALRLSKDRRVVALDARGRGRSDYDKNYKNYNLITEVGDVLTLVSREFERPCAVIGTSRGGLAAMILNAVRPGMVGGVALNDIGPELQSAGLMRIMDYLGRAPEPLQSWDDAVAALKASNATDFPDLSEEQWSAWARRTFREEDGRPAMDYDLRLRDAVLEADGVAPDFWPQFRALGEKPLLVLRGEHSDLLSGETLSAMRRVKPDMTAVTVKGRGHAPFLNEPESVAAIDQFIRRVDARVLSA